MKNQKIILFGVLIIAVLAVAGYFLYKQYNSPKEEVQTQQVQQNQQQNAQNKTNTDIANWHTYANSEYGFSFKYPLVFPFDDPSQIMQPHATFYHSPSALEIGKCPQKFQDKIGYCRAPISFGIIGYPNFLIVALVQKGISPNCQNLGEQNTSKNPNCWNDPAKNVNYELIYDGTTPSTIPTKIKDIFNQMLTTFQIGKIPTVEGQCLNTAISKIGTRLIDGITGENIEGSGSQVEYANGEHGTSYESVQSIENSKVGDTVNLCLVSIPKGCPIGDDRGYVYKATNVRTGEQWSLPNSEHGCGGA